MSRTSNYQSTTEKRMFKVDHFDNLY